MKLKKTRYLQCSIFIQMLLTFLETFVKYVKNCYIDLYGGDFSKKIIFCVLTMKLK